MENRKYDPKRKWIIEVTEEQLCDIIEDTEDVHRFLCGETGMFNTTTYIEGCDNMHTVREELRKLQKFVTPELERYPSAAYDYAGNGCPNDAQRKKIARTYAIYRNLRHCLTLFRNTDDWNVYKSETLTSEEGGPLAVCRPKEPDGKTFQLTAEEVEIVELAMTGHTSDIDNIISLCSITGYEPTKKEEINRLYKLNHELLTKIKRWKNENES